MANKSKSIEKEIRLYFCPKCKSTDIKYVFEMSNLLGIIPKQRCMKCNLELNGFPILTVEKSKLENIKKKKTTKNKKNG